MNRVLGFDFGTSNTAVAYVVDGKVANIAIDRGLFTTPTSVFFDFIDKQMLIGGQANAALIEGRDGRYMRALKSVLGTSLMQEKRLFLGKRVDFYDIITDFIIHVKKRAEAAAQTTFDHALAGRPVFFHSENNEKDIAAENDLKTCFARAGFTHIEFMFEPEAAALAAAKNMPNAAIGLVIDIGGGTSDFTLFRMQNRSIKIIASNGLRLGGTDFDRVISFDYFMPLLGRGADLKRHFAKGHIQAPAHIYAELSTWEKIPFLYDQKTKLLAESLLRDAVEPNLFERLLNVLDQKMGHDLAFLAEETKIALNDTLVPSDEATSQTFSAKMGFVEKGLIADIARASMDASLKNFEDRITKAIEVTLKNGNIDAHDVARVIPVGGSSTMAIVSRAIRNCLPNAVIQNEAIFTSIVDGLAIRAGQLENSSSASAF